MAVPRCRAAAQKDAKPASDRAKAAAAAPAQVEVRNWAKADANKDNLISPEELAQYLKDNPGPLRSAPAK